jgi:hypothetical protein
MNIYDACFRTSLRSPMRELDTDTTENASRLARLITDEHSDGLGLDDYEACDTETGDIGTYGEDEDSLYVELGDDAIRERAASSTPQREASNDRP